MSISLSASWRKKALATGVAALLALPLAAFGQTYQDPVIPEPEKQPDRGQGGSGGYTPPDHNTDPITQDGLLDSTGTTVTSTREAKALEFESDASRITGNGIDYDPGLDSAEGGGADGGFPYWEANNDWTITESAHCEVAGRNRMAKVAGTKEQSLSCYVDWMNGSRQYVDPSHCEAGANNVKPAETKSYEPSSCPAPSWRTSTATNPYGDWFATSGWYRASWDRGDTCGTVTEQRNLQRTRPAICDGGTNSECRLYHGGVMQTNDYTKQSRSRWLGSCWAANTSIRVIRNSYEKEYCRIGSTGDSGPGCYTMTKYYNTLSRNVHFNKDGASCYLYASDRGAAITCDRRVSTMYVNFAGIKSNARYSTTWSGNRYYYRLDRSRDIRSKVRYSRHRYLTIRVR